MTDSPEARLAAALDAAGCEVACGDCGGVITYHAECDEGDGTLVWNAPVSAILAADPTLAADLALAQEARDHRERCHNYDPDSIITHLHTVCDEHAADLALAAAVLAVPRTSVVIFWQAGDVTVLSNMGGDGGSYNADTLTEAIEAAKEASE